jgi:hypothetical protein
MNAQLASARMLIDECMALYRLGLTCRYDFVEVDAISTKNVEGWVVYGCY